MKPRKQQKDLLPGTLEMLILQTLRRGALHGYAIAQHIQQTSDDVLLYRHFSHRTRARHRHEHGNVQCGESRFAERLALSRARADGGNQADGKRRTFNECFGS